MTVRKKDRKRALNGHPIPHYYKRAKGKYIDEGWEAKVTIGYDANGKQLQKRVRGNTAEECQEKIDNLINTLDSASDNTIDTKPTNITLGQWMMRWIKNYCEGIIKERTCVSYASIIDQHILPAKVSKIKLQKLTASDMQNFYNGLSNKTTGKKLSPKTVKNIRGVLHAALEQARVNGIIKNNPTSKGMVKTPKVKSRPYTPIEAETIAAFISNSEHKKSPYRRILLVMLLLGIREGEAIGLAWHKINWQDKTIKIDKQIQKSRRTKDYQYQDTKEDDTRLLVMPQYVIDLLREEKAEQDKKIKAAKAAGVPWGNNWGLIFTRDDGRPLVAQTLYTNFKRRAREVGIPDTRVHDLRHQCATNMLEAGVDIDTTFRTMGHHDAKFTIEKYANATRGAKARAADKMDDYMRKIRDLGEKSTEKKATKAEIKAENRN